MHDPFTIRGATVASALEFGTARLRMRPDLFDNPGRDAQQILEVATGLSRVQMLAQPGRPLLEEQAGAFQGMIAQRRGAVPIQHLRGTQDFFGRTFSVSPDVLIPRPETEGIVEEALRLYPDRSAALRIADVGTGSGILAITLLLEYPQSTAVALDVSPAALEEASGNVQRHGVGGRVKLLQSDLMEAVQGEQFDLVVSNPPYIPLGEASGLHPQVRDFEPHLALFGGEDGCDVIRRLVPQAWSALRPGGVFLMETAGRSPAVDGLLSGWSDVCWIIDLQGVERVAGARK